MIRRHGKSRTFTSQLPNAARVIGPLEDGLHLAGLTNGEFSMIDAVEHCARQVEATSIWVSTWTTGVYDLDRLAAFEMEFGRRDVRFLIDPTIFKSRPEFSGAMIRAFGEDRFRFAPTHAKVVVLRGRFDVALRGSLNLNRNLRTENLDISCGGPVSAMFADWFEALWDAAEVGTGRSDVIKAIFDRIPDTAVKPSSIRPAREVARSLRRLAL